jgi:hypothetical protein
MPVPSSGLELGAERALLDDGQLGRGPQHQDLTRLEPVRLQ